MSADDESWCSCPDNPTPEWNTVESWDAVVIHQHATNPYRFKVRVDKTKCNVIIPRDTETETHVDVLIEPKS